MSSDWVAVRLAEAKSALGEKGISVPDQVVQELSSMLQGELQTRLKPSEIKEMIVRLAKANKPAAQ